MRVLHVVAGINPESGGVSRAIQTMVLGLTNLGIFNEVVSLDRPDSSYLKDAAFKISAVGPGKGAWCYSPHLLPWLVDHYTIFDIVIIHGMWLYPTFAAKKALTKVKRTDGQGCVAKVILPKLFLMPHGMLDPYFQKAEGRKLKALRNWLYWKIIEGNVINSVDKLLFTCNEERLLAKKSFSPYIPKSESVVSLGVEKPPLCTKTMLSAFYAKCFKVKDKQFLLFLSRIHEKKGLLLLIETYMRLAKIGMETPILVIAGPGLETSYGQRVLNLVNGNVYLKERIFFTGMLTGDAKWGAFYGCSAFILPSYQENFGIAVVEALSCSKPVLISNQVNIHHEIRESHSGIIANPTQSGVDELVKVWISLSQERRFLMGQNAKQLYESLFTIESSSKLLLEAFK